ncbi:MAG: SRPBCC domain-containing protein [Rhodothermales bacterium]|nr:SRPBCC domain-containing protein [Rhodothermales bacterium]MBO6779250.1 SRPBCC domain-containing protein [Rhodothermales bacterium]
MLTQDTKYDLDIDIEITVDAPIERVFEALIHRMGAGNKGAENAPMPMVLERRPGGRWFRDLGDDAGHLWGHVQSIRPPSLLEICGPLMMSAPVTNNVITRLKETDAGTVVTFRHTAHGPVEPEWEDGMREGWAEWLGDVKADSE